MKRIVYVALRAVIAFFTFVGISKLIQFVFYSNFFGEQDYFGEHFFEVWNFLILLLVYQSTVYAFRVSDRRARDGYYESANGKGTFVNEGLIALRSLDFFCEFACVVVISAILPPSFCFDSVCGSFFYGVGLSAGQRKLWTLLIIIPVFFVLGLISHIFVQKQWLSNKRKEQIKPKKQERGEIFETLRAVATVAFVYAAAFAAIPWLIPAILPVWQITKNFMWIIILFATLIVLAAVGSFYLRAILKRRDFLSKLEKLCKKSDIRFCNMKKPYASVFFDYDGFNFSVLRGEKKYDCKLIAGIFPNSPIVFSEKGDAYCRHSVKISRAEIFSVVKEIDFAFESDGKKILIVLPTPKKIFVGTQNPRLTDTGENAGEYKIHTASGFLGALERDCLDK